MVEPLAEHLDLDDAVELVDPQPLEHGLLLVLVHVAVDLGGDVAALLVHRPDLPAWSTEHAAAMTWCFMPVSSTHRLHRWMLASAMWRLHSGDSATPRRNHASSRSSRTSSRVCVGCRRVGEVELRGATFREWICLM